MYINCRCGFACQDSKQEGEDTYIYKSESIVNFMNGFKEEFVVILFPWNKFFYYFILSII